ncbi:MAG TPA: hypothetical protein VFZ79_16355 [Acidimicrobiales bacterium]
MADDEPAHPPGLRQGDAPGGRRRSAALVRAGTILAMVAVVAGFLVSATVVVMRQRVLDASTYTGALVQADAYDRVYTEILADPELGEAKEDLLAGIDLGGLDPGSARILATNSLRWAVPPSTLRAGTERFVDAVLAYVRGDTGRIDGTVELDAVLGRLEDAAVHQVRAAPLAAVGDELATTVGGYRAAVAAFADSLASGRIPATVPVAGGEVTETQVVTVLLDHAGDRFDPDLRAVVEAEVAAGNGRDALITALSSLVAGPARAAEAELRDRLAGGRLFDPVAELADRPGGSEVRVVQQLDTVRDAASWFGPPMLAVGLVLMAAGGAGLVALHPARPARAALAVAAALVLAGLATLAAWLAVRVQVAPPLRAATGTGPGSWNLPPGLRGVVRDVEAELAGALAGMVVRVAAAPIVLGTALVGAVLIAGALDRRPARAGRPRPAPGVAVAAVTGVGVVVGAVVVGNPAAGDPGRACNGHAELCDRHYDEVVQAATHNSMSSPDVVQVWPEHDGTIAEQLDAGIRTLLIDTHFWTDVASPDQVTALDPAIPRSLAARAVERANDRFGARDGIFLCHNHCVWGGRPLVDSLDDVRAFLDANPDDVVTLIVQDETPAADTVAIFAEAGLDPYLYTHDEQRRWPTLGEMVDADERLVVFAENEDPPPAWYHPAFDHMADTPFGFAAPEEMSCDANRGPADAPLLLMNHWLSRTAPDRQAAAVVNAHDAVVERARRCESERGQLPDFVAVDFYGIGDVVEAVDTLNGVGG